MKPFSLHPYSDPEFLSSSTSTGPVTGEISLNSLRSMLLIRAVESKLADAKRDNIVKGPVHLGIGQEAIPVGLSCFLNSNDYVFGAHRSHSHIIALGCSIHKLFAEILARPTGLSGGMGGSMHLSDPSVGFCGSVPIVAGTVPLAVGAAMSCQLRQTNSVAVSYLGDGACEEGVVHESLNLASLMKLPVVFVVENNLFASHLHLSQRQPLESTSRFAQANSIPYSVVDGNDFIAMHSISESAVNYVRSSNGPYFIEAVTFRWKGHVDWRDDIDVGVNRSADDIVLWKKRDPVIRLKNLLIKEHGFSDSMFNQLNDDIFALVNHAWEKALADPCVHSCDLTSHVYSNPS